MNFDDIPSFSNKESDKIRQFYVIKQCRIDYLLYRSILCFVDFLVACTISILLLTETDILKKARAPSSLKRYHKREQNLHNAALDTALLMLAYA